MKDIRKPHYSDESGVALLTVLGVIAVVTALAIGSYTMSQQSLHETNLVEDETRAYRAAASGLDSAMETFQVTDLSPKTGVTGDGSYEVNIEKDGSRYRLVSEGVGSDGSKERVSQEFYLLNLWDMNFSGGDVSGGTVNGASNIVGPFYTKGDLQLSSSMSVQEGPFYVYGGSLSKANNGVTFGTSGEPIAVYCNDSKLSNGGKIYISGTYPQVELFTPTLTKSLMESYASTARAQSVDNNMGSRAKGEAINYECSVDEPSASDYTDTDYTSAYSATVRKKAPTTSQNANYKFIGAENGEIAELGKGTYNLKLDENTPSFGWWEGSPSAYTSTHDDFAWDKATKTLYVEGTVFIDGNLDIGTPGGKQDFRYVGNGTLVVNGYVKIGGLLRPKGSWAASKDKKWMLGIVTPETIEFTASGTGNSQSNKTPAAIRAADPEIAGAFYAKKRVSISKAILMQGSLITDLIDTPGNNVWLVTNPDLPGMLPESLPGGGGTKTITRWTRY